MYLETITLTDTANTGYVYEFISFLKITNVNNHVTETDRVAYMHIVWENNETRKENIAKKKLLPYFLIGKK